MNNIQDIKRDLEELNNTIYNIDIFKKQYIPELQAMVDAYGYIEYFKVHQVILFTEFVNDELNYIKECRQQEQEKHFEQVLIKAHEYINYLTGGAE